MKNCNDCKHCPVNWREMSQLPICDHPSAVKINGKAVWSLYSVHGGHCGEKLKHFEKNRGDE